MNDYWNDFWPETTLSSSPYIYHPEVVSSIDSDPYVYHVRTPRRFMEEGDEIPKMKSITSVSNYKVVCDDFKDLSADRILKTISMMKGKLQLDCAMIDVKYVYCMMTPKVKENLVKASKRLSMYGLKRPYIAQFDEYGNRLPDELKLDTAEGMRIEIVNPETVGVFYLSLEGVM